MREIQTETLRQWLEDGRPVTILDIRTPEDWEEWSIPGSRHIDAYERLKAGDTHALADVDLPADLPVVTICNRGKVSQIAAQQLRERGIDAYTLKGGMKAWSLAWNTAELAVDNALVVQVRRTGKGCLSYLIGSGTDAAVIDASVDPEVYLRLAARRGWTIRYVLDTHIHADHLSRSRLLAQAAGATLILPAQRRVAFPFMPIEDDESVAFGHSRIRAVSTPGHTMESTCYDLNGQVLFTGDTLFLTGVGRPDLHASADETAERARILYRSLRRICGFAPGMLVFPGHTARPVAFDGRPVCGELGQICTRIASFLSDKARNDETNFIRTILARIPTTPPNFSRIVELNEAGRLPDDDPTDLEAGANRCAVS